MGEPISRLKQNHKIEVSIIEIQRTINQLSELKDLIRHHNGWGHQI